MSIDRTLPELAQWYAQYDDASYRQASPDAYHQGLLHTAQALRDEGALAWDDWLALKALADQAHMDAVDEAVRCHVSDPNT
ncbi:hypothetical protein IAE35_17135 [Pseudomonas sp. S75]|uniref:hypothetical protein n=1 Tax=unclassified Pseudomonas TaxID=196821 RepID=UPI00190545F3|nr:MULTISPECIES: hypothetical protein [unclassified Pseudomonas]MBJ9977695.1 hypothetical protein [Pseudomonas sp. S30]MBK0155067.1 hypothetical protein [Pseudomonas sp. S75]